jgi:hypothetical protein
MDPTRWRHALNPRALVRQESDDLHENPGRMRMKIIAGLLVAAALAFASGCAKTDWIDRTLVTVDVTGTWYGRSAGGVGAGQRDVFLELKQEGSRVSGSMRTAPFGSGPIDGTVAGDVFRFKNSTGGVEGEVTVSGDEMIGRASLFYAGGSPISLRRVDSSSPPSPPPR